jgi:cyclopropane-fatty-acyl-phospholipid synthase
MLHSLLDRGWIPDPLLRFGIRRLLAQRLREAAREDRAAFLAARSRGPVAVATGDANVQHYEIPAAYFALVLGPRRKYSSAFWPAGTESLAHAEEAMLALTAERAGIRDGDSILELGCGWGSLCLYLAERFPESRILAVSNSRSQRAYIEARAPANLEVRTADLNHFDPGERFARVVSVEMFEHMRNWGELLRRIAGWLRPEGTLFVHHFSHREYGYPYEDRDARDWMARHFFTGGIMPFHDLLAAYPEHLEVRQSWRIGGRHYARTLAAWLHNHDSRKAEILDVFAAIYGAAARTWFERWRVFYIACEELFAFRDGAEWGVSQHLLAPR